MSSVSNTVAGKDELDTQSTQTRALLNRDKMKVRGVLLAAVGIFIAYIVHEQRSSTLTLSRTGDPPFDMAMPKQYFPASQIQRDHDLIESIYANRLTGVTGKVVSFEEGWRNERVLVLETGASSPPIRLELDPESRQSAKISARPGTIAKLGCKYIGETYLKECHFYYAQ
jgi:hypothetical protein